MEFLEIGKELLRNAKKLFEYGDYTSSSILASKSVFAFVDFILFKKVGLIVSDHKKRFDAVRFNLPDVLPDLEYVFKVYTSAYRMRIAKKDAEEVIKIAEELERKAETATKQSL